MTIPDERGGETTFRTRGSFLRRAAISAPVAFCRSTRAGSVFMPRSRSHAVSGSGLLPKTLRAFRNPAQDAEVPATIPATTSACPPRNFVAAWIGHNAANGTTDVWARRFDGLGNPLGDEFVVNQEIGGNQGEVALAAGSDGRFVVAWTGPSVGTGPTGLFFRLFDGNGVALTGETLVNPGTLGLDSDPAAGEVALSWYGCPTTFSVYRSTDPATVVAPEHLLGTTPGASWVDTPPEGSVFFYQVVPDGRASGR